MTLRQRARFAQLHGNHEEAEKLYQALIAEDCLPEDVGNFGALLNQQGRFKEAILLYEKHLKKWPKNLQILCNAANVSIKGKDQKKAISFLEKALKSHPKAFQPIRQLSRILLINQNEQNAVALLETFCERNPEQGLAWLELGVVLCQLNVTEKALKAFEHGSKALPEHSGLIANRLTLLKDLNHIEEAEKLYKSISLEKKSDPNILGAWAGILMRRQKIEEAIEILNPLSNRKPDNASHWINLSACQKAIKCNLASQKSLKKGLRYCPNNEDLEQALAQSFSETGNASKAIKLLKKHINLNKVMKDTHIFNLQFIGAGTGLISSEELSKIAKCWEEKSLKEGVGPLWPDRLRKSSTNRKLRIGYISSDFCNHPVARFLLQILQSHNKDSYEIIAFSCGPYKDKMTELISKSCTEWHDLSSANDMELARIIADLRIDVLIELGGYTGLSRLRSLIYKPAPVQLSYLGYFAPTYLECMDGWIGDKELFGSLNTIDQDENLVLVDGGYMSFKPLNLPILERGNGEKIRFGTFNNSRKINAETISLFCNILNEVPNSELVVKSITFVEKEEQERIKNLFIQAGLQSNKLTILDWVSGTESHMALYKWVDIALDPIPYGGATTTAEALWMGVPVITHAGKGMAGRLSSSLLFSAGCEEWIAKDLSDYQSIAIKLASKGPRDVHSREEYL